MTVKSLMIKKVIKIVEMIETINLKAKIVIKNMTIREESKDHSAKKKSKKTIIIRKRHPNKKYDKNKRPNKHQKQAEAKKDTGFMGTVKSFFGALFGKKK